MNQRTRKLMSFAALAPLVIATSCSTEPKKRGQLMLAISADLSIPENMNEVVVEVLDEQGNKQNPVFPIQPSLLGKPMPGTIAIVPTGSGGERVRVRVIGQQNDGIGTPRVRVVREAVVTIPRERVGMLTMPLRWLCDGQVEPSADGSYKSMGCGEDETCIAGRCAPNVVNGDSLPDYQPQLVYGGGDEQGNGGKCVEVAPCFEKGVDVVPDSNCTIPAPTGGSGVNVGMVPNATGVGHCEGPKCYVPLDQDDAEGWSQTGSRIQLPPTLCGQIGTKLQKVVVTTACETKSIRTPTCGPWTQVTVSAPVGPQTPPLVTSGEDAGVILPLDGGGGFGGSCTGGGTMTPLQRLPSAMFLIVDGSSNVTTFVPGIIDGGLSLWQGQAFDPNFHVGMMTLDTNVCGGTSAGTLVPLQQGMTQQDLASNFLFNTFTSPTQSLESGIMEATAAIKGFHSQYRGAATAAVYVSAGSTGNCDWTNARQMATNLLTGDATPTHVIVVNGLPPSQTDLTLLAQAGGTSVAKMDTSTGTLSGELGVIQQGLMGCRYDIGGAATVALQDPVNGTVPLMRNDVALGCSAPGYFMPDFSMPSLIELCPNECALVQGGSAQVVAGTTTTTCTGGGGTTGAGGATSTSGGTVGSGGTMPDASAGGTVACIPLTCSQTPTVCGDYRDGCGGIIHCGGIGCTCPPPPQFTGAACTSPLAECDYDPWGPPYCICNGTTLLCY